jgi:DNA repair photolyase
LSATSWFLRYAQKPLLLIHYLSLVLGYAKNITKQQNRKNKQNNERNKPQMKQQTINSCKHGKHTSKTGTLEWARHNFNIGQGCRNGCLYCYALNIALRFGRIQSRDEWENERLRAKPPAIKKYTGGVMFPSTHDISPFYLAPALEALKGLLSQGNKVLVVSKPQLECIARLCRELTAFKSNVLFRFSIGSLDERLAALWEPGAPSMAERVQCLCLAKAEGYDTSVSMEPLLAGADDAIATFNALEQEVTEKIWIGKMNQVNRRVDQTTPEIQSACRRIHELQSDQEILRLVRTLDGHSKVEWKDSIKKVVAAHHELQAGQDRRIDMQDGWGSPSHIEVSNPTELKSGQ